MTVLSARGLSKAWGVVELFVEASLTISRGQRVGVVGVNGTGKSTFLRVLAGLEPADVGTVETRRGARIAYLPQEPAFDPGETPRALVTAALSTWHTLVREHEELTRALSEGDTSESLVARQAEVLELVEHAGGFARDHVVLDVLGRLGVDDVDRDVAGMSGGELRRVAIARILVQRPDLAIFDEPTNHLDAETIDWLAEHLVQDFGGAVLLVTHDRHVLDAMCDRIVELDRGRLMEFEGNYTDYLEQKQALLEQEARAEASRLNFVRSERAWLQRGPKARSTKQKARIQRAEAAITAAPIETQTRVTLEATSKGAHRKGQIILEFKDVAASFGDRVLFEGFDLSMVAGERLFVMGPNGVGKTTLLRLAMGELAPSHGEVIRGSRTTMAYFDQTRAALEDDWTVFDNVAGRRGALETGAGMVEVGESTMDMYTYLQQFLFDPGKQRQKVGSLSGGERARVALAKTLRAGANLLLFDEPTNDLDVVTLGALEEMLEAWPGCALVVSHDRWFIDRLATGVLAMEPTGEDARAPRKIVLYQGDCTSYLEKKRVHAAEEAAAKVTARRQAEPPRAAEARVAEPRVARLTYAERIELEGLLDRVSTAEEEVTALEARLADPGLWAKDAQLAPSLGRELDLAKAKVTELTARWEELEARRVVP